MASPSSMKDARAAVARRLDALAPSAALSARLLVCAGATWAVHALELVVFTFTRAQMDRDVGMGSVALEVLGASSAIGALLGGPLFGFVADARGRRAALLLAMTLSLFGFVLSAAARVHYEVLIARVVAGVGLGGELPAATVLVYELAPHGRRARAVALLQAFAGVGGVVGVLLAFFAAPALGWRGLYLALGALVLLVAVVRVAVPESPLWLASVGRADEALAAVTKLERASISGRSQYGGELQVVVVGDELSAPPTPKGMDHTASSEQNIDQTPSRMALAVLFLLWTTLTVSAFALGTYLPTMVSLTGFNVYASWSTCALLYVAQIPGALLASALMDRRYRPLYRPLRDHERQHLTRTPKPTSDRKLTLALFTNGAVVFAVGVSYLPWSASGLVVTTGVCLVSFSLSGVWSAVLAYTPEHFPVATRARGVGFAVAFGGAGGVVGSIVVFPRVYDVWMLSMPAFAWIFGGVLAVVAAVCVPRFGFSRVQFVNDDVLEADPATTKFVQVKYEDGGGSPEPEAEEGGDGDGDEQLPLVERENSGDAVAVSALRATRC